VFELIFRLCFTLSLHANALLNEALPFFYTFLGFSPLALLLSLLLPDVFIPDKVATCSSAFSEKIGHILIIFPLTFIICPFCYTSSLLVLLLCQTFSDENIMAKH